MRTMKMRKLAILMKKKKIHQKMKMIKKIGLCERVRSWIAILTGIVPPFWGLFPALGVAYALIRLAYLDEFCTDSGIPGSIWMILKR